MKRALVIAGSAVIALALVLNSCVSINEDMFFVPQPVSKATTPAEMKFADQRLLTDPSFASKDGFALEGRLPATITHEFVELGGERLAVSHVVPANMRPGEPLIVHCGGNATDRFHAGAFYSQAVLPWGEALFFDYPGYGDSSGKPTVSAFNTTLPSLGPWIDAQAKNRPLVFWGQSIGGLICSRLASHSREVDAVILETTGLSPAKIAEEKTWFIPFLKVHVTGGFDDYDIGKLLKGFPGPVLVVGAGRDAVLPVPLSRRLAKTLTDEGVEADYLEVASVDHMGASRGPEFAKAARTFFARVTDARH